MLMGKGRVLPAIFSLAFVLQCTPNQKLQNFEPSKSVSLPDLLDQVPALKSIFESVDLAGMDARSYVVPGSLSPEEIRQAIIGFMRLSVIAQYMAPQLIDNISGPLHDTYSYYAHRPDEFNRAIDAVLKIAGADSRSLATLVLTIAEFSRIRGNHTGLFPQAATYPFPPRSAFQNCDANATAFYSGSQIAKSDMVGFTGDRKTLFNLYAGLRPVYCGLVNTPENILANRSTFLYNMMLISRADNPVIDEDRLTLELVQTEANLPQSRLDEERLANWLAKDTNLKAFTDFAATAASAVLSNDYVWPELKTATDSLSELVAKKNQDNGQYIVTAGLTALGNDAPKIQSIESYLSNATQSSPAWKFLQDIFSHPQWGLNATLSRSGGGSYSAGKEKLLDMLWDGRTVTHTVDYFNPWQPRYLNGTFIDIQTYTTTLTGVLNAMTIVEDVRTVNGQHEASYRMVAQPTSTQVGENWLPHTYKDEASSQSFLNNLLLFVYEKYRNGNGKDSNAVFEFINQVEYNLHNLTVMDREGGNTVSMPLITGFLFNSAIGAGYIDPYFSPATLTLQAALRSNLPSDKAIQGAGNTGCNHAEYAGIGLALIPLFSQNGAWDRCGNNASSFYNPVYRSNIPWLPDINMPVAEAISPGKFLSRTVDSPVPDAYLHASWKGIITAQQGDAENANFRMGTLLQSLIALNAWQGYGPYTVKGKAPNGSALKYRSDYTTDSYRSEMRVRRGLPVVDEPSDYVRINVAMGNNTGKCYGEIVNGGASGPYPDNIIKCNGGIFLPDSVFVRGSGSYGGRTDKTESATSSSNLHIYEKIYRPSPAEPCYGEASENGKFAYARWGYLRPSNDPGYANNANCSSWEKIQVDFDDRESAIVANARWLLLHKKLTLVIPTGGADTNVAATGNMISLAAWSVNMANGLLGLMHLRSVPRPATPVTQYYNGAWNFFSQYCPMGYLSGCATCDPSLVIGTDGAHPILQKCPFGTRSRTSGVVEMVELDPDGYTIINGNTGLVTEPTVVGAGASVTHRFAKTSFEPGDSSITTLYTLSDTGAIPIDLIAAGLFNRIDHNFYEDKPDYALEGLKSLRAIALAEYGAVDLLAPGYNYTAADFRKFRKFYEAYFKTDDYKADGSPGADGVTDLWQMYERSITTKNCMQFGRRLDFCLTAKQMPYLPRAAGVSYPSAYQAGGQVAAWQTWSGPNEHKFQQAILALVIAAGTEYDSRQKYVTRDPNSFDIDPTHNHQCVFSGNIITQALVSGTCHILQNEENSDDFFIRGYLRRDYKSATDYQNEQDSLAPFNETTISTPQLPIYNPQAISNNLIETSPGARDGLLPKVFSSMYLHPQVLGLEAGKYLKQVLGNFALLADGQSPSAFDKIRYLLNGKLTEATHESGSGVGLIAIVKQVVVALREASRDEKTLTSLRQLFLALDKLAIGTGGQGGSPLDSDDVLHLYQLLLAKNMEGVYVVDQALDALAKNQLIPGALDTDILLNSLSSFKKPFDDLNTAVIEIFGEKNDLGKKLFYGGLVAEPYVDFNRNGDWDAGEPYVDYNKNGTHDGTSHRFANTYPVQTTDFTDVGGLYQTKTALPDISDPVSLIFTTPAKIYSPANATAPLTRSDIAQTFTDLENFQLYPALLGNSLKTAKVTTETLGTVPLRDYLQTLGTDIESFVITNKDSIDATVQTFDELLKPASAGYLAGDIIQARSTLFRPGSLKGVDLMAAKNAFGSLLYNADSGQYEYFITNLTQSLLPIQRISIEGSSFSRDQTIASLDPLTGSFAAVVDSLRLGGSYDAFDVLIDVNTLLDIKQVRDYQTPDTLWYQASDLLRAFSEKAYLQYNENFSLDPQYYPNFVNLFREAQNKTK